MAKASLHVKRHLTRQENATIRVALLELLSAPPRGATDDDVRIELDGEFLLDDGAIEALMFELRGARKVKICRSKTSSE